jgi:hypothetical protein
MSYTHLHLPEVDVLKKILTETPDRIKYYMKYGALMGSNESMNYLNQKIDDYRTKTLVVDHRTWGCEVAYNSGPEDSFGCLMAC